MSYSTKGDLYLAINNFREANSVRDSTNMAKECLKHNWAKIAKVNFKTVGLKGMSYIAANQTENNVILLKNSMPSGELNFVCGHEIVHVNFHKKYHIKTFSCFDKIQANQNSFLEWQANEGSAEITVPMNKFLPKVKETIPNLKEWSDFSRFKYELTEQFNVSIAVITYRFESLKYEIFQYLNGTSLQNIKILSRSQQKVKGINVKSYNDVEESFIKLEKASRNIDITV